MSGTVSFLHLQKQSLEFGELEWLADAGLFSEQFPHEALVAAEVPQLPVPHTSSVASHNERLKYFAHNNFM